MPLQKIGVQCAQTEANRSNQTLHKTLCGPSKAIRSISAYLLFKVVDSKKKTQAIRTCEAFAFAFAETLESGERLEDHVQDHRIRSLSRRA